MSTLKTNNMQVGQSGTATNNFTLYQPSTPDGTVRLGLGNSGATTSDVMTITSAGNVKIVGTNTASVLQLENSDTTINSTDDYGIIKFVGNDADSGANGTRAEIRAASMSTSGQASLEFYTTQSGNPALNKTISIVPSSSSDSQIGYLTGEEIKCGRVNGEIIGYSLPNVSMTSVDTQVDVDITGLFVDFSSANITQTYLMQAQVVGIYDSGGGTPTYARLHKTWDQHIFYNGTTWVIAGAQLISSYNSDATNFPAGAVNAAKVLTVVNTTQVLLRLQNRTTPAATSATTYRWRVSVLRVWP